MDKPFMTLGTIDNGSTFFVGTSPERATEERLTLADFPKLREEHRLICVFLSLWGSTWRAMKTRIDDAPIYGNDGKTVIGTYPGLGLEVEAK